MLSRVRLFFSLLCMAAAAQGCRRTKRGYRVVDNSERCALSLKESNGFFCDTDASWEQRRRKWVHQQPKQQISNATAGHVFWQQNWEPDFACEHEERIGSPGDGGKWLCNPGRVRELYDRRSNPGRVRELHDRRSPPTDKCVVYSIGSDNIFDFEESMHERLPSCEIHTFDHTVPHPTPPSFVTFHRLGLGVVDAGTFVSLPSIMARLNHTFIEILKIDVEGAEYEALMPLLETTGLAFARQILIELHHGGPGLASPDPSSHKTSPPDPSTHHKFFTAMRNAGWVIFHKEPNTQYAGGTCIEYGFVKLAWNVKINLAESARHWCNKGWTTGHPVRCAAFSQ